MANVITEFGSRLNEGEKKRVTTNDGTVRTYQDDGTIRNDFRKTTPTLPEPEEQEAPIEEPEIPTPEAPESPLPEAPAPEAPAPEAPKEETKTEAPAPIVDIAGWKAAGSKMEDLEGMIETKYGGQAIVEGNTITSEINGEKFQWKIDSAGNPIKTSLGRTDSEQHMFAKEKGIKVDTVNGKTVFRPDNIDQALDLYDKFGGDVNIGKESNITVRASAAYKYLDKYTGGSVDTLLDGLRKGEIGVAGETWDRLVRRNNGEASPEMIEAQRRFEDDIKLYGVNESNNIISTSLGVEGAQEVVNRVDSVETAISKLDTDFQSTISQIYNANDISFADYKKENEKLTGLNDDINSTAEEIDELNTSKRDIMDEIRAKYPNMDRSSQIELYNQKADAFDDQLFVLQRTQNSQISAYNLEATQTQAEYEYNVKRSEQKIGLIQDMYNIKRGDLVTERGEVRADEIRQEGYARQDEIIEGQYERQDIIRTEDFARQDKILSDSLVRIEEQRKQAIIDGDAEQAKAFSYEMKLTEEKLKLNRKYGDDIKLAGGTGAWIRNPKTMEWELQGIPTKGEAGEVGTPSEWVSSFGTPTSMGGKHDNYTGIDFDGEIGDPILAPLDMQVVGVEDHGSKGYGKTVITEDGDGNRYRFSHLDDITVKRGDFIQKGGYIGPMGNSGYVIPGKGGDGSHLDFVTYDPTGKIRKSYDTKAFMESLDSKETEEESGDGRFGKYSGLQIKQTLTNIPATLKNAIAEKEEWEKVAIEALDETGGDIGKSLLMVAGWDTDDSTYPEIGDKLGSILMSTKSSQDFNYGGNATALKSDNIDDIARSIRNVESYAISSNPTLSNKNFADSAKVIEAETAIKEIEDKIDGLGEGFFGQWDGRASTLAAKLANNPDYTGALGDIENFLGPIRTERFGVNLTGSESGFVDNFMPDTKDPEENIKQKLQSLKNSITRGYNSVRISTGLKEIPSDIISDDKKLVDFYRNTPMSSNLDPQEQGPQQSSTGLSPSMSSIFEGSNNVTPISTRNRTY